jgi:leader peptidase (prepilin peptidase) / N-methyltransferase
LGLGDVVLVGSLALSLGWLGWDHLVLGLLVGLSAQAIVTMAVVAS